MESLSDKIGVIELPFEVRARTKAKAKKLEDITAPNTVSVNLQAISNEELAVREVNPAESVILN
jgi:hypothetical protein